jgi:hypothetical protein
VVKELEHANSRVSEEGNHHQNILLFQTSHPDQILIGGGDLLMI